jgi:hypothetical protein
MVSAIYTAQNSSRFYDAWKSISSLYFAFATSIYILFFYLMVNNYLLNNSLDFLIIKFTNTGKFNFILNMIFYFFVPIMSINYLLIFRQNQHKQLIKEYKSSYNKKIFLIYLIFSIVFMYAILFLKK